MSTTEGLTYTKYYWLTIGPPIELAVILAITTLSSVIDLCLHRTERKKWFIQYFYGIAKTTFRSSIRRDHEETTYEVFGYEANIFAIYSMGIMYLPFWMQPLQYSGLFSLLKIPLLVMKILTASHSAPPMGFFRTTPSQTALNILMLK